MISYPIEFRYRSQAGAGIAAPWTTTAPEDREATCAIPPEFEGPGQGYSPEDFFGLAVMNCFIATFKVVAEKSRLAFESLAVEGNLIVDRDEKGRPVMKAMHLLVKAQAGPGGDPERLHRILVKTSESCIVVNSVKTQVSFAFEVA